MKKFLLFFLSSSLFILSAFCNEDTHVQKTHRIPQFENGHVKVWKTVIMPHEPLAMHRHDRSRVVVGIKGGTLKKIEDNGSVSDLVIETGKAYWFEPDPKEELHGDINESEEPIEVMLIEFK